MRKFQVFSSFIIKILAIVFMTFDHVGIYLKAAYPYQESIEILSTIFRSVGRLALPLFVFMIVEGVIHTKSFKKYIFKLGIVAISISAFLAIATYTNFGAGSQFIQGAGNIFIDLILIAVSVYLLKQDNQYLKLLILLPLGLSIASFAVKCYENSGAGIVYWYPNFLYLQADWFSLLLGIGFYMSYKIAEHYKKASVADGVSESYWDIEGNSRLLVSIAQIFILIIVNVFFYTFKYVWPTGVYWDVEIQLLSIISGAFILLYNGTRGYNAKWFQLGAYLYYPLHITVLIIIYAIIHGGI